MAVPPERRGSDWTGYALVKYGIILIIVIVILYFVVAYLLPNGDEADNGGDEGLTVPTEPEEGGAIEDDEGILPTETTG